MTVVLLPVAGLVGGHDVAGVVLGEVGDVAVAVLVDGGALVGAELAAHLRDRAFPVAGVDLVVVTRGRGVEHMVGAGLVGEVDVADTLLIEGHGRAHGLELVGIDRVEITDLNHLGNVVVAEALVDDGFVGLAVLVDGGFTGDLGVLPDFAAVAVAILVDGQVAAFAVALVTVGIVGASGLVDVDLAVHVVDLFGGGVVGGAVLDDHRVVGRAHLDLFDVGLVAVAVLVGFCRCCFPGCPGR